MNSYIYSLLTIYTLLLQRWLHFLAPLRLKANKNAIDEKLLSQRDIQFLSASSALKAQTSGMFVYYTQYIQL